MVSNLLHKVKKVAIPLLFWLGVWQLASFLVGLELLLPSPKTVALAMVAMMEEVNFWRATATSLGRIFGGFFLGGVIGTFCAILSALHPWVNHILGTGMKGIRATPVASFIVLVLLWSPTGWVPVVVSALMVVPILWGNVCKGIEHTDPLLLEAAKAYRFSHWKTLWLVYVPSVRPYFASGCNTALGLAWKAGVAAEVLCQPSLAIGTQMYRAKLTLETADVFGWTIVVIVLSLLLERGLAYAIGRLTKEVSL